MKRRHAIRNLVIIAGGAAIFPSCITDTDTPSIELTKIKISGSREKLMADIANTLIPATDTPGAGDVGAHLLTLVFLNDCYEKETQDQFMRGLNELDKVARKRFGNPFSRCRPAEKESFLREMETKGSFSADMELFYKIMKQRTIQGYTSSEYVLKNILKYELVPSVPYNGYAPVKNI